MHAYDLTLTLKFKDIHASMDVLAEESSRLLRKPDLFIYLLYRGRESQSSFNDICKGVFGIAVAFVVVV